MPDTDAVTPIPTADTDDPRAVVLEFLDALARSDVETAASLVSEDLVYINVSLPTVRGRSRFARLFRAGLRPGRIGFDVRTHHIAADGDIVLTDRTDEISIGRLVIRFWVYGRFQVQGGRITLWRDSFDWRDILVGSARGWLGVLVPALNRQMPAR
ncbi:DUF4440 domain-containing protein [Rhodococcus triatomae]|uniref:Limonene-1,2-epoxide hydrolase n=1 Tax=Rhodococcus triatomae TaxID=300028 RepID=A0A1G8SQJ6_9NOCA|nr:limonene-1,2-epoxide hydrolase family protein [Rhodococcus triatomae]QNG20813.1 DUF4440 domain-containing protein [Rhodococcus triatomae]QNG23272.1 DUF4440 domain-containing protein [Rhodococcus triatomae]SDJ31491.1 limonene-1,2-epoxide hydrolase [Rhodococcus triatomae]